MPESMALVVSFIEEAKASYQTARFLPDTEVFYVLWTATRCAEETQGDYEKSAGKTIDVLRANAFSTNPNAEIWQIIILNFPVEHGEFLSYTIGHIFAEAQLARGNLWLAARQLEADGREGFSEVFSRE